MKRIRLLIYVVVTLFLFNSSYPLYADDSLTLTCTGTDCVDETVSDEDVRHEEGAMLDSSLEKVEILDSSELEIESGEPEDKIPESTDERDDPITSIIEREEADDTSNQADSKDVHEDVVVEETDIEEDAPAAKGAVGLSLLSQMTLSGTYDNRVTLTARGRGVLNLNLLKDRYVIFKVPMSLLPYIDRSSFTGTYNVPSISLLGIEIGRNTGTILSDQWHVNEQTGQVVFKANHLLSLSLLSPSDYTFQFSFHLHRLPLGHPQTYTFYGHMTNGIIDIELISDGLDRWNLQLDGPLFSLAVPSSLDFGTIRLRPGITTIYRQSPMRLQVSHERASGYPWRLTARASPLTAVDAPPLSETIYFRNSDGTILSLEQGAQFIASGTMNEDVTELVYESKEGIFLDITSQRPEATRYSTTIEWTLVNAL